MELNLFYKKNSQNKKFEETIYERIKQFIKIIEQDKKLSWFIISFWIVWPCARGQWFWYDDRLRSDVDFFAITSKISPSLNTYMKNKFQKVFETELDCALMIANEIHAYRKPDLMFFEYISSGNFLYGKEPQVLPFIEVSKFEVFRNIIYRSTSLLKMVHVRNGKISFKEMDTEKFLYHFSKIIFMVEEIILILKWTYVADNLVRSNLIKEWEEEKFFGEKYKNIHDAMTKFRYENKIPEDFHMQEYLEYSFEILEKSYAYVLQELFEGDIFALENVHPNISSIISTRVFYILRYWESFWKIRMQTLVEPFVKLSIEYYAFLQDIQNEKELQESKLQEILELSAAAPWFYYKI